MLCRSSLVARAFFLVLVFVVIPSLYSSPAPSWSGVLRDTAGNPVGMATIKLVSGNSNHEYSVTTYTNGEFAFGTVATGNYSLTVSAAGKTWTAADAVVIKEGATLTSGLQLLAQGQELRVVVTQDAASPQASGGEH